MWTDNDEIAGEGGGGGRRSKPHPDLTTNAHMEEKTEVSKRVASEAKDRQWKKKIL